MKVTNATADKKKKGGKGDGNGDGGTPSPGTPSQTNAYLAQLASMQVAFSNQVAQGTTAKGNAFSSALSDAATTKNQIGSSVDFLDSQ